MSARSTCVWIALAGLASVGVGWQDRSPQAIALLDRYASGQFDAVVRELDGLDDFGQLLKDLKSHAGAWMVAGGAADQSRRELAVATFALEAARVDEWREWKWIQESPLGPQALPTLYWKSPPLLIEWACELLRKDETPRPIERIWQLASLAVAQRSEDTQFLIGFTKLDTASIALPPPSPGAPASPDRLRSPRVLPMSEGIEVINEQDEIGHLNHTMDRFPAETRFVLGQAIARERDTADDARRIYTALAADPDVGGEATMRLGLLLSGQGRLPEALTAFDQAARLTRDPEVVYLTNVGRGQALLRLKREAEAAAAFKVALKARPATESASLLLGEMLFRAGDRVAAQSLMADVLAADPRVRDPFLEIVHADDRFWPQLIATLRREIRP